MVRKVSILKEIDTLQLGLKLYFLFSDSNNIAQQLVDVNAQIPQNSAQQVCCCDF